ncbi:MAG: iron transporter, partial [Firmicutes bacterium]|nr:iron transporter [Bacillota bacterium]
GEAKVTLIWSSPNYDYMIVDGEKLTPVNEEGNSTFEVPVKVLNEPFTVIGDTTAMSQPHEIEYKLTVTVSE